MPPDVAREEDATAAPDTPGFSAPGLGVQAAPGIALGPTIALAQRPGPWKEAVSLECGEGEELGWEQEDGWQAAGQGRGQAAGQGRGQAAGQGRGRGQGLGQGAGQARSGAWERGDGDADGGGSGRLGEGKAVVESDMESGQQDSRGGEAWEPPLASPQGWGHGGAGAAADVPRTWDPGPAGGRRPGRSYVYVGDVHYNRARGWGQEAFSERPPPSSGAAFRAALRQCRCVGDIEALLQQQHPHQSPGHPMQSSAPAAPEGNRDRVPDSNADLDATAGGHGGSEGAAHAPLPPPAALSVPSLTALISALPKLPEASTAAGRARMRVVLRDRVLPLLLAAARRRGGGGRHWGIDAAGAAIMAGALAALGRDVVDPRDGVTAAALEELAEAGMAAWRLTPLMYGSEHVAPPSPPSPPGESDGGGGGSDAGQLAGSRGTANPAWGQRPVGRPLGRYGHTPRSASSLLRGLAALGHHPGGDYIEPYLAASGPLLRACNPMDLASFMWALAVWGHKPSERWLDALLRAWPVVQADRQGGVGAAGGGAGSSWVRPAAEKQAVAAANGHSLSLVLWALWRLGVNVPGEWVEGALGCCAAARFRGATCQSLALMVYACARMGHVPGRGMREALLEAAAPLLQRGSVQDVALLLAGLSHWKQQQQQSGGADGAGDGEPFPPAAFVRQALEAVQPVLHGCSVQPLVLLLTSLSYMRYRPSTAWLLELERAVVRHQTPLERTQYRPHRQKGYQGSPGRFLAASDGADGGPSPRALARIAAAWAVLGYTPQPATARWLAASFARQADGIKARHFSTGLHGVAVALAATGAAATSSSSAPTTSSSAASAPPAVLPPLMPQPYLRALMSASEAKLQYCYLDEQSLHLRAWALLRARPAGQWLANWAAAAATKLTLASPGALVELLALLAWPGWAALPCPTSDGHHELEQGGAGPEVQPQQQQQQGQAQGQRGIGGPLRPSGVLLDRVVELLLQELPTLAAPQLAAALGALAGLGVRPGRRWLVQALAAAAAAAVVVVVNEGRPFGEGGNAGVQEAAECGLGGRGGVGALPPLPDRRGVVPGGAEDGLAARWVALRAVVSLAVAAGYAELEEEARGLLGKAGEEEGA